MKNTVLFLFYGFFTSFQAGIVLSATQDILGGSSIPSTVILVLLSVPNLLVKLVLPWVSYKLSYVTQWAIVCFVTLLTTVLLTTNFVSLRMVGVVLGGASVGITVVVSMAMMAQYPRLDVQLSANRTGLGLGDILSSLAYTGLTTWTCVAPRTTIAASIPFGMIPMLLYCLLDKRPLEKGKQKETFSNVKYTLLKTENDDADDQRITFKAKCHRNVEMLWTILPLAGYLYLSKMSRNLCLNAILTSVAFPNAPFLPRDHFQYYMLIFTFARLLGGSGPLITSRASPEFHEFCKIRRIWILAILDVVPIAVYLLTSWYRIITDYRVIFVICFAHGLISGMLAVYSSLYTAEKFGSKNDKGVALGLVEISSPAGVLAAGTVGAVIEPLLKKHCYTELLLGDYCSTRFNTRMAWTQNQHCA